MVELSTDRPGKRVADVAARVSEVATRQWGVIGATQLRDSGLSKSAIGRWAANGRLHRLHPGVYVVGHRSVPPEGRLVAALLYAGPGSVLSHLSAAWWWGLIVGFPAAVAVSTRRRCRSLAGVDIHRPREVVEVRHRRLPTTSVPRALLDSATLLPFPKLRRALAEAEYQRLVELGEIESILGRGLPGSAALRRALELHRPELARTLSELEERFLAVCEKARLPIPEVNVMVEGLTVDMLWREQRLIVELDGHRAHANPAAIDRDRERELILRAAGYVVLRYTWRQVTQTPSAVVADIWAALGGAGRLAAAN